MDNTREQRVVLLVEDDPVTLAAQCRQLEKLGYQVLTAVSGEEAIESVRTTLSINLILMDISLGDGIDGIDAAGQILKEIDVPVIFLSQHTGSEVLSRIENVASYGYIVKGSGIAVLDTMILQALRLFSEKQKVRQQQQELIKHKQLAELLPQGVAETDIYGNIIFVNENGLRMFGYTREDLENGVNVFTILQAEDPERVLENLKKTFSGELQEGREYLATRKDGSTFPIMLYSTPVMVNEAPVGLRAIAVDISDQKRWEEELAERERRLRVIFDNSPLGLVHLNEKGIIINCNERFAAIMGVPRQKLLGFDTLGTIRDEEMLKVIRSSLQGKRAVFEGEYRSLVSGKSSIIRLYANPVSPGQSSTEAIGSMEDISDIVREREELARIEAQLNTIQKLDTVGKLAGGIAHDFNNLLTPMMGYAELIKNRLPANSELLHDADEIIRAATRAKELIRQILVFSKGDDSTVTYLSMNKVLAETVSLIDTSHAGQVEIVVHLPEEDLCVKADYTRMVQIVMNLATNGVKAMNYTGTLSLSLEKITIDVENSSSAMLSPGAYVLLTVADTGCGIEESIRDRIFEPFFTAQTDGAGTGLGLSVVHGIVTSHGGAVTVDSAPGQGARFYVYLPGATCSQINESSETISVESAKGSNAHILVVDDREDVLKIMKKMLQHLEYQVTTVSSGREALELIESDASLYDLLISDLTMPQMTGLELVENIHRIKPDIPAVIMTGHNEIASRKQMLDSGVADILYKPITTDELIAVIEKIL